MPGIFGVIDSSPVLSERHHDELFAIAKQMSAAMRYESFYSETLASCPALGACFGRVGLFDAKLADCTQQDIGVTAIVAGETAAKASGNETTSSARLRTTAHDVVHAYRRAGEAGLATIHGICAGFIADQTSAKCLVFSDRYGRERIFLHNSGTRVFFASEAKAILAVAPRTRTFDPTGLAELLACGCTLGTQSLFCGIEILEGGTVLTLDGTRMSRRRYFDPATLEHLAPVSANDFLEGFSDAFRSAVNVHARSTPRVGISLTGGLDSRMVMACLDAPPGSVPCYTFGSMYRTTRDVAVGRVVASRCGQPHHVLELGKGFLGGVRESLEQAVYISDGYLGLSGAAELYVNRQASALAPARMTGNWGGELMRGVRAFKYETPRGGFLTPDLAKQVRQSAATFSTTSSNPLSAALFQQLPFQGYGRYAIERSQVEVRSPFLSDDVIRWLYQAPAAARGARTAAVAVIGRRPDLLGIPTDLGLLGAGPSFMRHSSRRILIKAEYLTSHGTPDWLARLMARVPASFLETRFLGIDKFQHFRFWMRRELAGLVRETLIHEDNGDLKNWFDMRRVSQIVNDHIAGHANYTNEIDKLLTITTAQKLLIRRCGSIQ